MTTKIIGARVIRGGRGPKGLNAYQQALAGGFDGTEAEWLESLKQPAEDAADAAAVVIGQAQTATTAATAGAASATAAAAAATTATGQANAATTTANTAATGANTARDQALAAKAATDAALANLLRIDADVVLVAQAYTTTLDDLGRLLNVTTGAADATVTLASPVLAGDGAVQILRKADTSVASQGAMPKRLKVRYGGVDLAWLYAADDVVALRSNGVAWSVVDIRVAPVFLNYTVDQSVWDRPPRLELADVTLFGPGGPGASGRRGAIGTVKSGGGAGAPGLIVRKVFRAAELPATVTMTLPDGGTGGAAQTVDSTNGNVGVQAANAFFGTLMQAQAGGAGAAGTTTVAAGGNSYLNGSNVGVPNTSPSSSVTAGTGVAGLDNQMGTAGAGGGITAANAVSTPPPGSNGSSLSGVKTTGGTAGTFATPDGGMGAAPTDLESQMGPGGAGGGYVGQGQDAGKGGDGQDPGGGGGGGGASDNGFKSGAGGKGGKAACRVLMTFR